MAIIDLLSLESENELIAIVVLAQFATKGYISYNMKSSHKSYLPAI